MEIPNRLPNTSQESWWVYIIETDKSQLYTGITTDVDRRWQEHCAVASGEDRKKGIKEKGAKFFRTQKPVTIVHRESFKNRSEASKRESKIKKMTRLKKRQLCGLD